MIGGLTYLTILDRNDTDPQQGISNYVLADYNESMSFAKWLSLQLSNVAAEKPLVFVWNWNGGSGFWNNGVFIALANDNYPTP